MDDAIKMLIAFGLSVAGVIILALKSPGLGVFVLLIGLASIFKLGCNYSRSRYDEYK